MKYLLDTNVISEMQKTQCNQNVKSFVETVHWEELYLSAITIGEICYGIEKLSYGKKKHDLSVWLYTKLPEWFSGRIITLDSDVMMEWGRLCAKIQRKLPFADSLIASSAITHHMFLVTRNTKDFEDIEGINIINPWEF
ncbi:MAG: type II toxin-antitoxin system VapC family toxin [Treponema sp.]|nr:type II toxin-antitoxin system VapC family toxin [Treponema sp.]